MINSPVWYAQYEEGVPHAIDIPDVPIYHYLRESARQFPHQVVARLLLKYLPLGLRLGSALTYAELEQASDRFANALYRLGVRQNDRVAIMLPNVPQYMIAFFGILKAGAIAVNTNPTYTPRELHHQLHDSGAETMVTLTGLYQRVQESRQDTQLKRVILTDLADSMPWHWRKLAESQVRAKGMMVDVPPAPDVYNFYELLRRHPAQPPKVTYAPDDVILFQYSGGTTGTPKAAMLTHRNMVSNIHQIHTWFTDIEVGKEKLLGALPLFHVYGMTVNMLLMIKIGAELVMVPDPRQVDLLLEIIAREKISFYPGVPAMYSAIINHPRVGDYNLHSIKGCFSAGSSLPGEVARKFEALTGGTLVEGYGLSETSPVAVANPIHNQRRVGSIGVPVTNTYVEIVTLEPDEKGEYPPVPQGEQGELVIYGPQVMKGYWNQPEETAMVINARGGLHTGDIARMDEDGFFYIVDRKKDLIIASGYNVVPREVEEVLFMHPQVIEACVAGIPNARRGETVKAYVVLKPDAEVSREEIRTFCQQYLAPYKVPTVIEFRQELPKSQVGKVLRRLLVEEEKAKQQAKQKSSDAAPVQAEGD